jgi:hypothetical protein
LCLCAGRSRPYAFGGIFRELQNFERTGPFLQPPDIAAFLQRRDKAVDTRFRPKVERILHFVERGRHARFPHALVDEHQELILLLGQHGSPEFVAQRTGEQSANTNRSTLVLAAGQRVVSAAGIPSPRAAH